MACGRIGYEPLAVGSEDGGPDELVDAGPDGSVVDGGGDAAIDGGALPSAEVSFRGASSCQGEDTTISLTGPAIPAGRLVIVHIVRAAQLGTVTISDSQGNTYEQLGKVEKTGLQFVAFQSSLASPLGDGDTITANQSITVAASMVATEVSDVNPVPFSKAGNKGADQSITVDFDPPDSGVVLCGIGTREGSVEVMGDWNLIEALESDCGGANGVIGNAAYWIPSSSGGMSSCQAGLVLESGTASWVAGIASFSE